MMGFAVLVGAILARTNGSNFLLADLIYGYVTGFALTAGSMVANDYYDRNIDAINEPNRPIPSGLIRPREALAFAFLLVSDWVWNCISNKHLFSRNSSSLVVDLHSLYDLWKAKRLTGQLSS